MTKPRNWLKDGTYHITNRGTRKEPIFFNEMDKHKFMLILVETRHKYHFKLHAYCLMPNHYHLLIQTESSNPSEIMKVIQQRYSRYFNKMYQSTGHVFQERFHSSLITEQDYWLNASRYIHMNPVAAGLVTKAQDYPWSSYPTYLIYTSIKHPLVDTSTTLSFFHNNSRELYKKFVEN